MQMISEDTGFGACRRLHLSEREYAFFSHCHRRFSIMYMFLISTNIIKPVIYWQMNPMAISDHVAVDRCMDINTDTDKKSIRTLKLSLKLMLVVEKKKQWNGKIQNLYLGGNESAGI